MHCARHVALFCNGRIRGGPSSSSLLGASCLRVVCELCVSWRELCVAIFILQFASSLILFDLFFVSEASKRFERAIFSFYFLYQKP